jgi:TetR/AcrR family transcriptional repressor of nem operon
MATQTKAEIVERAEALIRRRGFKGFSYRDIAEPLGIKNAAVHYHFRSKADLGVAVIERYREKLKQGTSTFMRDGGEARLQLEGYLSWLRREYVERDRGCPIGVMGAEFDGLPDEVRRATRKLVDELLSWLTRVLEVGREQGAFSFEGPAEDKAVELQSALSGAGHCTRISGHGILEKTLRQVRRDLGMDG